MDKVKGILYLVIIASGLLMASGLAAAQLENYPGFPKKVDAAIQADIVVTSLDSGTQKDFVVIPNNRKIYVFRSNGTLRWDRVAGTPFSDYGRTPAVSDINGDNKKEIIMYGNPGHCCSHLYMWDSDGNLISDIYVGDSVIVTPPSVADIGEKIILAGVSPGNPPPGSGATGVYAYNNTGGYLWYIDTGPVARTASIAVGDIDGDAKDEAAVVVNNNNAGKLVILKFNNTSASILLTKDVSTRISGVAIGDINNDGMNEIIVGSGSGVFVWSGSGSLLWSNNAPIVTHSPPAIGDINGDGIKDIVIGSDQQRRVFAISSGNILPGFPVTTVQSVWSRPALYDLNGDGKLEVIAGDFAGNLYGWDSGGKTLSGFPIQPTYEALMSSPAVVDLNGNPQIVVGSDDGNIYIFTYPAKPPDVTSPITRDDIDGLWHNSNVTVTLTAEDADSGVAATYYTIDGSTPTTASQTGTAITLNSEGVYTIKYFSIDNAGNAEDVKTAANQVRIDRTPPAIAGAAVSPPNSDGWYNGNVIINFSATDALSGVSTVTPETTISTEGASQSATGTATDGAGNSDSFTVSGINIDKTPPATETTLSGTAGDGGWYVSDVTVTLSATDALSGVAATYYSIDGGAYQIGTSFILAAEGRHNISYYSVDNAGNTEPARERMVYIDRTPPLTLDDSDGAWHNGNVTVKLIATDNLAGVNSTYYRAVSGTMTWMDSVFFWFASTLGLVSTDSSQGGAVNITNEGVFDIYYYSTDKAGNIESEKLSRQVKIDKTLPVITVSAPEGRTYLRSDIITLGFTAQDELSGIKTMNSTIDGNRSVSNGQTLDMLGLNFGGHAFYISVEDNAGNINNQVVSFNVIATIDSLITLNNRAISSGWISNSSLADSLTDKLNSAKQNIDAGKNATAKKILETYINNVQSESGKGITVQGADILISEARYVIDHMGGLNAVKSAGTPKK